MCGVNSSGESSTLPCIAALHHGDEAETQGPPVHQARLQLAQPEKCMENEDGEIACFPFPPPALTQEQSEAVASNSKDVGDVSTLAKIYDVGVNGCIGGLITGAAIPPSLLMAIIEKHAPTFVEKWINRGTGAFAVLGCLATAYYKAGGFEDSAPAEPQSQAQ